MTTSFTIWHYLDFILIAIALIWAINSTLKQKAIPQKGSFIATYSVIAFLLLILSVVAINGYTKKVLLLNVTNHRFLSTESIFFSGSVRNAGNYDVGEVEIEIKIFDKGTKRQGRSSFESTAFEDYYNDADIRKLFGYKNKELKATSYTIRRTVAKELKAGHTKSFTVSIDYPSHFQGYINEERLIVH
ncbi:MAG: DUF2393 family protein [Sulfuricurvum sp.]|nr:DUF2393 family protein [Sulfuricurvum sp.]